MDKKLGEWAFIIGVLIAIGIGLFSNRLSQDMQGWLVLLLVVLGLIVGILNVSAPESTAFLVAAAVLLLSKTTEDTLGLIPQAGVYLSAVVTQIGVFVAPAAIVVALKSIHSLARD
ncbi:MAG: hypothetical protein AABX33_09215 [Nanoarchaeota archaeon]